MKKTLLFLMTLGVLGGPVASGLWANPAAGTDLKVAVVDFQRAINETEDGKQAERSLNTALEEKKKKFEILKGELEAMRQDFEKQRYAFCMKNQNRYLFSTYPEIPPIG